MRILLGIDESKFSKAAIHAVMRQARPQSDHVRVVHVIDLLALSIPDQLANYPDGLREMAETLVNDAAKLLGSRGLQVTTHIGWGCTKREILEAAAVWHADIIVLGSHGRAGLDRFLMGSVAHAIMRHARCSVELVRILPGGKDSDPVPEDQFTRILLAIDGSRFSEAAIHMLREQLQSAHTEVCVLYVVELPTLLEGREMDEYDPTLERLREVQAREAENLVARVAQRFCGSGQKVTTRVRQGEPKTEILEEAEQWKADLIVIGSHGRTSVARFLMGSVSEAVANYAHCSVEVVRS